MGVNVGAGMRCVLYRLLLVVVMLLLLLLLIQLLLLVVLLILLLLHLMVFNHRPDTWSLLL